MENQTAGQQECHEALSQLLETMPLDEAVNLSCGILARLCLASGIEPWRERWDGFFSALRVHLAAWIEALDNIPSPRIH